MGGNSEPSIVSGALAARVRENKAVCLTAIGGEAVSKTIRAICHARLYLEVRFPWNSTFTHRAQLGQSWGGLTAPACGLAGNYGKQCLGRTPCSDRRH